MKRNLFLLICVGFFALGTATSQTNFGIRFQTGIQSQHQESMYLVSPGNQVDYQFELSTIENSQSIGIFTQFNFGYLYFQPEILYTTYRSNYKIENFMTESPSEMVLVQEKTQRVDLPINAGITINNFRLGGGPIFQIAHDTESDLADYDKLSINHKKIAAGFQGGVGYQWKFVQVDVKYQTDFNSTTDHISHNDSPIKSKSRNSTIQLGVALAISK